MSEYTGPLSITELDVANEIWELNERLPYYLVYEKLPDGTIHKADPITAPAKFRSDGASIPKIKFIHRLLPRWGNYRRGAITHDFLCWCLDKNVPHPLAPTRAQADQVFFDAMTALKINPIEKWVLFIGARLGGMFPSGGDSWLSGLIVKNAESNEHLVEDLKAGTLFNT